MALLNLVDQYEAKNTEEYKSFLSVLGCIDSPVRGLLTLDEYLEKYNPQPGETFVALVEVDRCCSDPKYNRTARLHYGNVKKNLKKRSGFSHKAAGILSGFLRKVWNGDYWEYVVVVTKGNHRVTKRYAVCRDRKVYIAIELTVHSTDNLDEMIRIESLDHTIDAQDRTSQSQEHKFTSSFFAKETDAVNLYNYLDQFSIGIAETNSLAKFKTTSHNYISKARAYDDTACTKYLTSFTKNNCEDVVGGNAAYAGTVFLKTFKPAIDKIDELNNCDSFDGMMEYVFKDRSDKSMGFLNDVTQASITAGNGKFKGAEVHVSRFISLYNEYCDKVLKATLPETHNHAIGYSSDAYISYMKSADTDIRMRADEVAKTTV
tara:strand:+ start:934 stop:2058 length:1125 start_codon:yes stop_codon:yes gene_type:complete